MIFVLVHDRSQAAYIFLLCTDRSAVTLFVIASVIAAYIDFERFGRFLGNDIDYTSDRTGAVESRCGPFHDLDTFDIIGIQAVVIHVVERFTRHTFAVDQEKHIFTSHTLHVDCDLTVHLARKLHTRQFRFQQVLHGNGIEFLYIGSSDDTGNDRSVFQQFGGTGSRHCHFIQVKGIFFQAKVNDRIAV